MGHNKKGYSRQKHRLAVINMLLSPAILALLILFGIPTYIKNLASLTSPNNYVNLLAFSALMGALYYIVMLPLGYYSEFVVEHRYALSNQTLAAWIKREAKKGLVSFVISAPLILSLYAFLKYHPMHWWLLMATLCFCLSIAVSKFAPILIVPLFYKYSAIKNKALKHRLVKLASRVGFKTEGVYEINMSKDTKKANAAVLGLGRQKRIVLCDTLLENFSEDEIMSVMGHELGHHKLRHTLKLILFGGASALLIFFLANIAFVRLHGIVGYELWYDFDSIVLIYAIISAVNILVLPAHNAFSRRLEASADEFTLKITNDRQSFIQTMKKLADQNLADPEPGRFYEIMLYSHPPISRRISFAENFNRKK